jgi:hypothetical protein
MTKLAKALIKKAKAKKAKKAHAIQLSSIAAIAPYRFQPGQSGNLAGRGASIAYVHELSAKVMRSCPPKELCLEIGVDPSSTWGEAIMFSLSRAAATGDVQAAREVLAALGFSGTTAKNLMAVQVNPAETGLAHELLRHAHGLDDSQLATVYQFMDQLPKATVVVDASYFPPEEPKRLEETNDTA